jgi:hypothetical protein
MSEANRAGGRPDFEPGAAGVEDLKGSLKMPHFRGKPLQINLKSLSMQAGIYALSRPHLLETARF